MENEIMNNEEMNVEEIDLEEDVIVVCEDTDNSDESPIGLIVALGIAAAAGIAALIAKKKGVFDEMRIRRLEKKGYVVTRPGEIGPKNIIDCCDEVEAEEIDE